MMSIGPVSSAISPVKTAPVWRYQSPGYHPISEPKPFPVLLALQGAGIHPAEGSWLLYELGKNNDTPYYAGLLMNGKALLVSQNDRVFYGKPGNLKPLKVVEAWRTKCINEQTRFLKTNSGLQITLQNKNHVKSGLVQQRILKKFLIPLFPKKEALLPTY